MILNYSCNKLLTALCSALQSNRGRENYTGGRGEKEWGDKEGASLSLYNPKHTPHFSVLIGR